MAATIGKNLCCLFLLLASLIDSSEPAPVDVMQICRQSPEVSKLCSQLLLSAVKNRDSGQSSDDEVDDLKLLESMVDQLEAENSVKPAESDSKRGVSSFVRFG